MTELKSLVCPQCGSRDLEEIAWNRRHCQHCGAYSLLSDDKTELTVLEWQCPKCGFNNQRDSRHCGKCGHALVKTCLACSAEMRWDLLFCPTCGADYDKAVRLQKEEREKAERRRDEADRRKREWESRQRQSEEKEERRAQEDRKRRQTRIMKILILAGLAVLLASIPFHASSRRQQEQRRQATATAAAFQAEAIATEAAIQAEAIATAAAIKAEATASSIALDAPPIQAAVRHLAPQSVTCGSGFARFLVRFESPTSKDLAVTFSPLSITTPGHDPDYLYVATSSHSAGPTVLLRPQSQVWVVFKSEFLEIGPRACDLASVLKDADITLELESINGVAVPHD
jgi:ribosomal protein S27AE